MSTTFGIFEKVLILIFKCLKQVSWGRQGPTSSHLSKNQSMMYIYINIIGDILEFPCSSFSQRSINVLTMKLTSEPKVKKRLAGISTSIDVTINH